MKKLAVILAVLGLVVASCDKLPPLHLKKGGNNDTTIDQDNSDENANNDKGKATHNPDGDGDLDVITDPNNDEDYDGEGKKPVVNNNN